MSALLAACGKHAAPPQMPPPEVGVVTIRPQSADLQTELPGRTSAIETSEVRPQVNGIVQARLFTEGSVVRKGQVLYQIDPAPYRATYDQALASLANARAAAVTAKLKSDRYAELVQIKGVSKQEADDAFAAAQQAAATIKQGEASVEAAKINLDYTRVVAPIGGRIGKSSVTPGALVTASQTTALSTIQRMDEVYVDINQSSAEMLALRHAIAGGQFGAGGPTVRLKLEDGSDYSLTGKLQFADVTVDQATGAVDLRAIFPNPSDVLLPGMFVRAVITEGVQSDAILAPQQAVNRDQRGLPTAFVAGPDNKAELRTLKTGRTVGENLQVLDGLKPGDRLIVEGLQKVKPGVTVRAVPAGSPPTQPPAPPAHK